MVKAALVLTALAGLSACNTDHCADHKIGEGSCEGNRVVGCMRAPLSLRSAESFERDCGDQVCLNPEPGLAFCALQSEPDARCPTPVQSASAQLEITCSAGHLLDCIDGYVLFEDDCGAGLCYTPPPGPAGSPVENPACVASASADPRCAGAIAGSDPRQTWACLANVIVECLDDRVVGTASCGPQGCGAKEGCP